MPGFVAQQIERYPNVHYAANAAITSLTDSTHFDFGGYTLAAGERAVFPYVGTYCCVYVWSGTAWVLDPHFEPIEGYNIEATRSGKVFKQTAATGAATPVFVRVSTAITFASAGDGSDDVPALQSMLDSLAGSGAAIELISPTYTQNTTLTMRSSLTLQGKGPVVWNYAVPYSAYALITVPDLDDTASGTVASPGVAAGVVAIPMAAGHTLVVGDIVRPDQYTAGLPETHEVVNVVGNTIYLDYPTLLAWPTACAVSKITPIKNFNIVGDITFHGSFTGTPVGDQVPRGINPTAAWNCLFKGLRSEYTSADATGCWFFNPDWGNRRVIFEDCIHVDIPGLAASDGDTKGFAIECGIQSGCVHCHTYGCRGFFLNTSADCYCTDSSANNTERGIEFNDDSRISAWAGNKRFTLKGFRVNGVKATGSGIYVIQAVTDSAWDDIAIDGNPNGTCNNSIGIYVDAYARASLNRVRIGALTLKNSYYGIENLGLTTTDTLNVGTCNVSNVMIGLNSNAVLNVETLAGTTANAGEGFAFFYTGGGMTGGAITVGHVDMTFGTGARCIYAGDSGTVTINGGTIRRTSSNATKLIIAERGGKVALRDVVVEDKWSTASTVDATSGVYLLGTAQVPATITGPCNRGTITLTAATSNTYAFPKLTAQDMIRVTRETAGGTPAAITWAASDGVGVVITHDVGDLSVMRVSIGEGGGRAGIISATG